MFFITASFNVAVWLLPIVSNFAQAQWSCQGCPKFNSNWPTTPFKQFVKANTQIGHYRFWIEQPVQVFHWISIPLASSIAGCASLDSSFVRGLSSHPGFQGVSLFEKQWNPNRSLYMVVQTALAYQHPMIKGDLKLIYDEQERIYQALSSGGGSWGGKRSVTLPAPAGFINGRKAAPLVPRADRLLRRQESSQSRVSSNSQG